MTYYVYLLASRKHGTLYIGVTNDLIRRVYEHRSKVVDGFTRRYDVDKLVWFEVYDDVLSAIAREKELKKWRRALEDPIDRRAKSKLDGFVPGAFRLTWSLWIPGPRKSASRNDN